MECSNCEWFNGEAGDGNQFCDELETYVFENFYCNRWMEKKYYLEEDE